MALKEACAYGVFPITWKHPEIDSKGGCRAWFDSQDLSMMKDILRFVGPGLASFVGRIYNPLIILPIFANRNISLE